MNWTCDTCTYENKPHQRYCSMCQTARPVTAPAAAGAAPPPQQPVPPPAAPVGSGAVAGPAASHSLMPGNARDHGGAAAAAQTPTATDPLRKLCFEAKKGRWRKDQVRDFVNTRGIDPNALYANKQGAQRTPLAYAVEFNNDAFARFLLELEPVAADPNLRMPPTPDCPGGDTALTLAAKNEQYDGTEMVRILLARGADQAQLAEVPEDCMNRTMRYWRTRACERRVFKQKMLKAFKLEGLREVEFAVVGEQAATTAISNQIMHFVGQYAAHDGKPLVMFIPGAPGHGKTYFTKNLAKALVGEQNLLFLPILIVIELARELISVSFRIRRQSLNPQSHDPLGLHGDDGDGGAISTLSGSHR